VIDLAGSERAADSKNHDAKRMAETKLINASLSALKECIRARTMASQPGQGGIHVP
jgi:kinesin family protein 2/24